MLNSLSGGGGPAGLPSLLVHGEASAAGVGREAPPVAVLQGAATAALTADAADQLWGLRPPQGLGSITPGKRFHCRRREEPALSSSIMRALTLPGVRWNETQRPLSVRLDRTFGDDTAVQKKMKELEKSFANCPARCRLVATPAEARAADIMVFNQHFSPANVPPHAIRVMWSSEQLGSFFEHPELDLRISTSLFSNQTEVAFAYGCGFVKTCRANASACPPAHSSSLRKRPALPDNFEADNASIVSIISNRVSPRGPLLKKLSKEIETANYGGLGKNRKSPKHSGRSNYTHSKLPIMQHYPFAYVPENKWQVPWGYVSEKAYDAYLAGNVPIWEGGHPKQYNQLYFPPRRNGDPRMTMLRVREYENWTDAKALAADTRAILNDEKRFQEFFDWDRTWFTTGPLATVCREKAWCKMCAAAHIIKQGYCPPFM